VCVGLVVGDDVPGGCAVSVERDDEGGGGAKTVVDGVAAKR
jgi:hypothetical protein